jgi:hypothetical protein
MPSESVAATTLISVREPREMVKEPATGKTSSTTVSLKPFAM